MRMRNYLNAEERTRHIIIMSAQETIADMIDSNGITSEERRNLTRAKKAIEEFNASVCERLGQPYLRRIINTMNDNALRLVAKGMTKPMIYTAASEDLVPMIAEVRSLQCMFCERDDYKTCPMYAMCVALDIEGEDTTDKCPFTMDGIGEEI